MTRKFECHITLPIASADTVEVYAKNNNWSFSKIDGDALMEQKPYCYLTGYSQHGAILLAKCAHAKQELLSVGIQTLRIKIEEIVYDTKTGHNVMFTDV